MCHFLLNQKVSSANSNKFFLQDGISSGVIASNILPFNCSIIKRNVRKKQAVKKNGYQESIIKKSLTKLLAITACLSYDINHKPQISNRKKSEQV